MELRLLGTVRAIVDGREATLGGRQQRLVLAVLALHVNQPVAVTRMIDWIWPDPPRRAEHAVRVHVSQLRSALAEAEILAQGPAYVLRTDPSCIDVHRFQDLVDRAKDAEDEARVALLDEALALWEGPALADVADPELRDRLCGGLQERRLLAAEDRYDAMLRLGQGRDLIHDLTAYVNRHPTRERPVGQLMLALYRDRQQALALEVFRRTREMLAEELGIDPGPELHRLELAILRNDPTLDPAAVRLDVPALLPAGVADFTGREAHLRRLDEDTAGGDAVVISTIAGAAGIGKTTLALHWAHRARPRFPDGQLYANLDGFAVGPPLRPEQVLFQFLRALGVPAEQVPADLAEASGLYRTVLADRRVLVVLDNAASAEQVRPLLPASHTCAVLVTSRNRLDGLVAINAARRISLDVMAADEAMDLLARILGRGRVDAEPEAAAELARGAAYLPLALRIAATSLSNHPGRPIADYLAELRGEGRLDALELDETVAVRSTFALSYGQLKPEAQWVFRLMGLAPGLDISADAMTAMAGLPRARPRLLLDQLATTHLVDQPSYGRYTFHDLLRDYARETAMATDSGKDRQAALDRLFLHYRRTAVAAVESLYPGTLRIVRSGDLPDPVTFDEPARALAWLNTERANLVAAVEYAVRHGRWRAAWELADTLRFYLLKKSLRVEWRIIAEAGLTAAEADGDARAIGAMHFSLGYLAQDHDEARRLLTIALRKHEETGWLHGQAGVHSQLGGIEEDLGRLDAAVEHRGRAVELARSAGLRQMASAALLNRAMTNLIRAEFDEVVKDATESLELADRHEWNDGPGHALYCLGLVASFQGQHEEARRRCQEAVDAFHRTQATGDEASSLAHLSFVLAGAGDHAQALIKAREAVALAEQTEPRILALALNAVAEARTGLGEDASDDHRRALALAREIVARHEECRALLGLGEHAAALELARRYGFRLVGRHVLDLSPEA
ncbi:BTAD domain-containing putative transcriptional regulator [Kutzneria sp. NPDC052558]|uniref:AfsR/SARP family transcriptional regulator n=1 Tax=Kutzneria sp. NPDC052558 TaxID=3364121 RepID=UPI0037C65620